MGKQVHAPDSKPGAPASADAPLAVIPTGMLKVEASSSCQLRCPSCPTTTGAYVVNWQLSNGCNRPAADNWRNWMQTLKPMEAAI
jgi:hypothetical protein